LTSRTKATRSAGDGDRLGGSFRDEPTGAGVSGLHFVSRHTVTILLFLVALVSGALNSVAGGGSFLSFPMLLFAGIPAIAANATSTVALWPGTVASSFAYRKELVGDARRILWTLMPTSFLGAIAGTWILLHTPASTFVHLIPWLLLVATALFASGEKVASWVRARSASADHSRGAAAGAISLQLLIAAYVGYFGAGAGIAMLAMFAVMGVRNIHAMNGLKTVLVSLANAVAIVLFVWHRVIAWPTALVMTVGALLGGYGGAHLAQRMSPEYVRRAVIVVGLAMSLYFFLRR
jgi:uncharacterized membrane protein YfcA